MNKEIKEFVGAVLFLITASASIVFGSRVGRETARKVFDRL